MSIGGWAAVTARRPPWMSERYVPRGRERPWGLAMAMLGLGAAALAGSRLSNSLADLGILGLLLVIVGVGFLVVAVGIDSLWP